MNFNKCKRCGTFYITDNSVCPNCEPKDNAEIFKLKTFLAENDCPNSIEALSCNTGISAKNLNRFLEQKDFSSFASKLEINKKIFEIYMNSKSDYRRAENFYSRYEEHFEMTENEIYNKSFLKSKSIEEIIEQQMNGVANHLK